MITIVMKNMILKKEDYPGISQDINLDETKDIKFYHKKMKVVAGNNTKNSETAAKIAKVIEENYSEYLI